jgi:AcrR family transcriptional regulator
MDDVKRKPDVGPRTYHSPVRDEAAKRTRRAIVASAGEMFLERGYAASSVTDIARAAGVARPTVLTVFGTKAALLKAVVDVAMAGDDDPIPVAAHDWFQPVFAAKGPGECLAAYAHACLLIARRSSAVVEVVRRASDESAEVEALWGQLQANRRRGAASIVTHLKKLGPLAPDLTAQRATDLLWFLNDQAHYRSFVSVCGWSEKAYEAWLVRQMHAALLR